MSPTTLFPYSSTHACANPPLFCLFFFCFFAAVCSESDRVASLGHVPAWRPYSQAPQR